MNVQSTFGQTGFWFEVFFSVLLIFEHTAWARAFDAVEHFAYRIWSIIAMLVRARKYVFRIKKQGIFLFAYFGSALSVSGGRRKENLFFTDES